MVERLIDLAESTAIVWAVVNEVVTAVLLECQAGDHVRMAEQLVVCLVLNPDLKAILENQRGVSRCATGRSFKRNDPLVLKQKSVI